MEDYQSALIYLIKCYNFYLNQDENNHTCSNIEYQYTIGYNYLSNLHHNHKKNHLIARVKCLDKIGASYEKIEDYFNALDNYIQSLSIIKNAKGIKNNMYTKKLHIIAAIFNKIGNIEKS